MRIDSDQIQLDLDRLEKIASGNMPPRKTHTPEIAHLIRLARVMRQALNLTQKAINGGTENRLENTGICRYRVSDTSWADYSSQSGYWRMMLFDRSLSGEILVVYDSNGAINVNVTFETGPRQFITAASPSRGLRGLISRDTRMATYAIGQFLNQAQRNTT